MIIKIFIFLVFFISYLAALRCYTCTYVASESRDRSCLLDPESVLGQKITSCSKKYCVIQRQELKNPSGYVVSFLRSCEDKPLFINSMVEDSTFKTYFRACTTDLCNSGDGLKSSSGAIASDAGAGVNIHVQGIRSSGGGMSRISSGTIILAAASYILLIKI